MNDVNNFLCSANIFFLSVLLLDEILFSSFKKTSSKNYILLMNDVNDFLGNPNIFKDLFCLLHDYFFHLNLFDKNDDPHNCDCHRRKNVLQPVNKIETKMIKKIWFLELLLS
jgi:hypothetical protein